MLLLRVKQQGFSLLEVLISMVLIGLGYISLTYLNSQISEESGITMRQMESLNNAWSVMDELNNIDSIADYQNYLTAGTAPYTFSTATVDEFTVTQRIVAITTNPNYIVIEGNSTWTDSNGNSHTNRFRTALPEIAPNQITWYWG